MLRANRFTDKVHHLLTDASVDPVLRNIEYITEHGFDKLYEVRVLVHPGLVEEAAKISKFLAEIDPKIPLCFLAFRPNFVLENMRGATSKELATAVKSGKKMD